MDKESSPHVMAHTDEQDNSIGVFEIPEGKEFIDASDVTDRENVRTLILPTSVVWIREGSFEGMPRLTRVVARGFVYRIQRRAFYGCPCLREVVLPDVCYIEEEAFARCPSLERVVFGTARDIELGRYLFSESAPEFRIEFHGTAEQFKRCDRAVVGEKTVGWSGDYHHPTASHFEEVKAKVYAPVFSTRSGKFVCTVRCARGEELVYPSVSYFEWTN